MDLVDLKPMIATTLPSDETPVRTQARLPIPFLGWWPFLFIYYCVLGCAWRFLPLRLPMCWRLPMDYAL